MRRPVLLAAALVALLPGPAAAQTRTLAEVGGWRAFGGMTTDTRQPTCGMDVTSTDDRRFLIQHYAGDAHLTVRLVRRSWQIPRGTPVPVLAQIGGASWQAVAVGDGQEARWRITSATMTEWEAAFRRGTLLVVSFHGGGTEPPWRISLRGSNAISDVFVACLRAMAGASSAPTQPHGPAAPPPAAPAVIPRGPERRA